MFKQYSNNTQIYIKVNTRRCYSMKDKLKNILDAGVFCETHNNHSYLSIKPTKNNLKKQDIREIWLDVKKSCNSIDTKQDPYLQTSNYEGSMKQYLKPKATQSEINLCYT